MEQQVVPTSPKSEHFVNKKGTQQSSHVIFTVAVVTLLLGALAGGLGFVIASSVPSDWPLLGKLNVVSVLQEQRENVLFSTNRQEDSVLNQSPQVVNQIVALFADEPTLEQPAEFLGNAALVTSDGWMVTATSLVERESEPVVVLPDGGVAAILTSVHDAYTGLTFFQVGGSALPFVSFSDNTQLRTGQNVSVLEKEIGSFVVYERRIQGDSERDGSKRSTADQHELVLIDGVNRVGAPVFGSNGRLLGLVRDDGAVVPGSVIAAAVERIAATGEVRWTERAVEYVNLARVTDAEKTTLQLPDVGIYIFFSDEEDMKAGDVILSINNVNVDAETDLGLLLHTKASGTVWRMTVLREGAEMSVDVRS